MPLHRNVKLCCYAKPLQGIHRKIIFPRHNYYSKLTQPQQKPGISRATYYFNWIQERIFHHPSQRQNHDLEQD